MVLPASGAISIAQIADEFGIARTTPFPSGFYGLGGAPASGGLRMSDFYGRSTPAPTPTPTPAPTFTSQPQITPGSGIVGQTQYTIADPGVLNGSITAREWLINGAVVSNGGNAFVPQQTGNLQWRATAQGAGGTATYTSQAVTVSPVPPPAVTFRPDGGYAGETAFYTAAVTLDCSQDATWTYSTTNGFGGGATIGSGGAARSITFQVEAGGGGVNRRTRSQSWSARGMAAGVTRDFTIELTALGDDNNT